MTTTQTVLGYKHYVCEEIKKAHKTLNSVIQDNMQTSTSIHLKKNKTLYENSKTPLCHLKARQYWIRWINGDVGTCSEDTDNIR